MASIKPEPQIPAASPPPITVYSSRPSRSLTPLTAPGAAFMPIEMPAPSKAGPAVEQQNSFSPSHRAISPFVPTSMRRDSPLLRVIPLESTALIISLPTKADTRGGTVTRARPNSGIPSAEGFSVLP